MIQIVKIENKKGVIAGFRCFGHAEYAEAGNDIVCAAVSALIINTMNSIEAFTEDKFSCKQEPKTGLIEFVIVSDPSKESLLLLRSLFLGLNGIKSEYGEKYLKIFHKEV